MRMLRRFPGLCFALVLLAIVGLCVAQQSIPLLLLAGAVAVISWYVTEGPRGRSLPKWVANILVVIVCINVLIDLGQHTDEVLGVLGRFALWLTLIKLFDRRTSRDQAQLLGLSFLLMLIGCLQSIDLLFAIILLAYAALGLYVLLLYQLHAAHETMRRHRRASSPKNYRLVPAAKPIFGVRAAAQFRSLVFGIGLAGLVLSVLAFILFPRGMGEGAITALRGPQLETRTAFSEEIDLMHGSRITESRRPVLTLQVRDDDGTPIRHDQPLLLRGAVLDRYLGQGRWKPTQHTGYRLGLARNVPTPLGEQPPERGQLLHQHVSLIQDSNVLFSIYAPVTIEADRDGLVTFHPATKIIRQEHGDGPLRRYRVESQIAPTDTTLDRLSYGMAPIGGIEPRLQRRSFAQLGRQLLADAGLETRPPEDESERWRWNRAAAQAFTRYLHTPGEFEYTTDLSDVVMPAPGGRAMPGRGRGGSSGGVDPIEHFLFDLKRGHCEFFASALAALCHSVGIEARLVVGYVAYEYDEMLRQYNVLEANAHAWTEVRTGRLRWTPFDPTPPAVLRDLHRGEVGVAERLRWFYDRFDGTWGRAFVEFDSTAQTRLAQSWDIGWAERIQRTTSRLKEWLYQINQAFYLGPTGYIWMGIMATLLFFAVLVLIKLMRRSLAIRRRFHLEHVRGTEYQRLLRQLGFFLDMLRVLEKAGIPKPDWQPPQDFAEHLAREHPQAADRIRRIAEIFYTIRYGHRRIRPEDLQHARRQVQELAGLLGVRI